MDLSTNNVKELSRFLSRVRIVLFVDELLRIGELSKRTGVTPELLRAWELRYGLLEPSRSAGGFRLYSSADELRVRQMQRLIAEGVSAAEAARQAQAVEDVAPAAARPVLDQLAEQVREALDGFDDAGAHAALDRLLATVSVEVVLAEVVIPYLRDLGDRWTADRASIAQEHFASNLLRGRLLGLARDWGSGNGPRVLLACLPGEVHDLGLIIFGLLVARRGWRITLLGADTPFDSLLASIHELHPAAVVLVSTDGRRLEEHAEDIRRTAALVPTALAGGHADRVGTLGARALPSDIVEAAASIAG